MVADVQNEFLSSSRPQVNNQKSLKISESHFKSAFHRLKIDSRLPKNECDCMAVTGEVESTDVLASDLRSAFLLYWLYTTAVPI